MDGQSRTCIEWMCNDEYEPGSFDLSNIMSPPDHESIFHSLMNATPLGGEEWQAASESGSPGRPLARLPSDPACITPASLVSLVQHMELSPADNTNTNTGTAAAGSDTGVSSADPAAAPSLTEAVSEALGGGGGTDEGDSAGRGLARVSSATELAELATEERPPPLVRQLSVSCPNTPPRPRRVGNSFFTPSVFYPQRPAEICREWRQRHPDEVDAVAAGAGAAAPAAVSGLPSPASLATVGGMTAPPPELKKSRTRPRPSRLRELNFLAPTSM